MTIRKGNPVPPHSCRGLLLNMFTSDAPIGMDTDLHAFLVELLQSNQTKTKASKPTNEHRNL